MHGCVINVGVWGVGGGGRGTDFYLSDLDVGAGLLRKCAYRDIQQII